MFCLLFLYCISLSRAITPPSEQVAHDNVCAAFNSLGCLVGKPPCKEAWTVCEDGFVIALNIGGELATAFPDISGFTHLRNLSFIEGFDTVATRDLSNLSLLSTLRHFSIGPALLPIEMTFSFLPATLGTDWPNLEVFSIQSVNAFPGLPASIGAWGKLRQFYLLTINDMLGAPTFSIPLSLTGWTSLELFFVWDVNIKPSQALPQIGTKANLTEYNIRDSVTDAVAEPFFTSFSDDALFDSMRLERFSLINLPFCTGTLPTTFGHATSLTNFLVTETAMTGSIPLNVFNLDKLEFFFLFGGFTGTIPTTIGGWKSIEVLALANVQMSGTVPTQIGKLSRLKSLNLVGNGLSANKFSGTFPAQLANLAYVNLTQLYILNTVMNGKIPEPLVKTPPSTITTLVVSNNKFQCTLPDWIIETVPSLAPFACVLTANDFCQLPNPLQTADKTKCAYDTSHEPCLCDECPESPPAQDCVDCNGVNGGSSTYDQCDVCDGDNLSCADCNGVPNGSSTYDVCNICNGTNACLDCNGQTLGAVYDYCDVCGGDGTSCLDCQNTPYGTHTYDACDVCGGDGLSCQDCNGGTSGEFEIDLCGNCVNMTEPGYAPLCFDCLGVANGTTVRDLCGVCNGTTTECDPTEIGAGVVGLRVVVPWLIVFGVLDLLLLIFFVCAKRNLGLMTVSKRKNFSTILNDTTRGSISGKYN